MKKKKRNNIKYSMGIVLLSLLLFLVLIVRVTQLALSKEIDGINLKELASRRTTKTVVLPAKRGTIYSSDGEVLAQNVSSYKLIAYLDPKRTINPKRPQHVIDKEKTAHELSKILKMEESTILKYLSKENVYQTEFGSKGKGLTELIKQEIEKLNLPGLDFVESYKRYYPKGNFASYTIGYAKTKSEEENLIVGEMGIEKSFDKKLKGEDGYLSYQKDLRGYKIADTPVIRKDAVHGKDIYLTIDSNIQFFVEQALNKASKEINYEWFNITVLDAKTGELLASGTNPAFDPNKRDIENYLDTTVSIPYEPGSTMKTYTYMAAMENGVYNGSETYESGTYITKDGTKIRDWNRVGWGTLTFDQGYALSSNVAIINIINRHMNSMMLRHYYKKLGFGKKTKIELPNEHPGKLDFKYETEIFNAGFGQGITTTPIQHVQAMTSLTNDGIMLSPFIVKKIVDPLTNETLINNKKTNLGRVASTKTVNKIFELMDNTVNLPGQTGSHYGIESKELIGKTGTAQIANTNGKGYLTGKSDIITSFSGIYPKSNPQVIIYAAMKKPTNGRQIPISNAIKDLVKNISKYKGNDDSKKNIIKINKYKIPSLINKTPEIVKTELNQKNINFVILGNGNKIIKQTPKKDNIITNKDTIYLITNDDKIELPNLKGMSSKVVKDLLGMLNLKVKLEGVGYVDSQSISEGTEIKEGQEITIKLKPKF